MFKFRYMSKHQILNLPLKKGKYRINESLKQTLVILGVMVGGYSYIVVEEVIS